jgi:hypothetical protein
MLFCLFSTNLSPAFATDVPNKKEIIAKARQSYYNLRTLGLASHRCEITPNWDILIADLKKSDPAKAERALPVLRQIHFAMSLDADSVVTITHTAPAPENAEMAKGFDQMFAGMQQLMSGFFDTANPFILTTPFPEVNAEYQLEDQGNQYVLSYKEGASGVVTVMDKNLVISSITVADPGFTSTLQPQFTKNPRGLLLAGYMAIYKTKNAAEDTQLNTQIIYQDVDGLQLPQKLILSGSYGGGPFAVELVFSGYQVTRK